MATSHTSAPKKKSACYTYINIVLFLNSFSLLISVSLFSSLLTLYVFLFVSMIKERIERHKLKSGQSSGPVVESAPESAAPTRRGTVTSSSDKATDAMRDSKMDIIAGAIDGGLSRFRDVNDFAVVRPPI